MFCLAIVGIVIGGVFLLVGVVTLILIVILKRKRDKNLKHEIQTNQISNDEKMIFTEITSNHSFSFNIEFFLFILCID